MGGKKNQAQRTKNNARPSSSGRSAELLGTAKPVNPFLAFSIQKEVTDDGYQEDIDPNIQVVLKKMSKKDSTTKLKALQEFTALCSNEETEANQIIAILSLWTRQYVQLAVDIEHKVRESAHVCHEAVVKRCKRNLAPYLKQLVGPWFVSQCDTHAPAATAASRAFSNAFPPNKIQEAILFCQSEIIKYIVDNLTVQTAETLSNPATTTPEEREMKYQRILISCLQGYALYLERIPPDQLLEACNKELVSSKGFWKHAKNGAVVVRSAWYSALIALCQHGKRFLEDELASVAKATVGCLDEPDALVAPLVWEATLHALVAMPATWAAVSVDKVFVPKLYSICRKAGHGSASVTFPSLLPLISQIPPESLKNPAGFYDGLCSSLRQGLEQRSVQQSPAEYRAVVDALVECIQYCVAKNQESDPELCRNLTKAHLLPLLTSVENANPKIVVLLKSWSQREASLVAKELFYSCCDHITRSFCEAVDEFLSPEEPDAEGATPETDFETTLDKQLSVLTNLLKGEKLVLQHRNKKVKFAPSDEVEEIPLSPVSENVPSNELYDSAICGIAATLCGSYLKAACDTLNPRFVEAILKLVTSSNSPDIFINIASIYGYSESPLILSNYFLEWMHTPENPLFCKETVSLSLQLLFYLPLNAQQHWLGEILSPAEGEILEPKLLLWLLEELTTEEAKQKFHVEWMKNSALRSKLVELAQRVITSQEEDDQNIWTLLERVVELSIEEGHKDNGSVLKGILQIVEDSLQSEEIESKSWLVPATTLLGLLYDSRCLGVLDLPPDHSVVQTIFQVYLESIQESEQTELFDVCEKALHSIYRLSGPDSELFKNICAAINEYLQIHVLAQEWSEAGNLVTAAGNMVIVAARLSTLLRSLDEERAVLALLRKLCGPPAVPGTTAGPLTGSLSEYWSMANAMVCNAESVVSGGTYRSEADVLADRYSACLAEGIPNFDVIASQMDLSKAALWTLLSVATMADVSADADSVSAALCSLATDVCAALAVTSNVSQYFPSMELTYCVDLIKTQSDIHWKRFYSTLSEPDQKMIQEALLERAVEDLRTGGRYWVRALEYWLNSDSACLSLEEASRLLSVPAEFYSTVLISRLGLIKEGHLPMPVIPSSGTLETLNLGQFVELVMYLLSSEANQESVALQGLSALSCVHRLDSKRLLFDSNIFEKKSSQVRDVVRTMLFIRTVIVRHPTVLTEPHWDLILISVASWIPSLQRVVGHVLATDGDSPHVEGLTPTMVCSFVAGVCDLYASLQSVLSDLNNGTLKLPESVKKETITDAWRDVFAAECDGRLVRLWINLSDSVNQAEEISPMASLVLEHLSACVASVSLGYLDENMSADVEDIMEQLLSSISSSVPAIRLASYHLLIKLVPIIIKKDAEVLASLEDEGRKKSSEGVQLEKLIVSMFGSHVESLQNELEETFSGTRLGETLTVEPFTQQYNQACGYLLLWLVVLEMYGAANSDVRFEYASFLKSQDLVQKLLHNVFRLMPQIVLRKPDAKNKITHDYFTKKPSFECSEKWTSDRLSRTACQVFLGVLIRLPALARTWWGEVDSKSSATIDYVITEHCSSIVSAVEMKDVLRHQEKAVENMTVKVHMSTREVVATYTVDDLVMELVVKLPNNYPLSPMSVEIGKRSAAGSNQWRTWLMQITIFLTHQNGSLWDGLALWRNLVVRRYEGVEECYICFCVLHGATYQLPKLSCRTCRKKFHSQCLYKWFQTSNKSTCPICRNLF